MQHRLGVVFGQAAARYAASRPGYPEPAVDWLIAGRPGDALDLGAGSGALTRALTSRVPRVVAAEPSHDLLIELRDRSPTALAVRAGAEQLPFADASFDVVTVATAFHWFDPQRALPEIARVLRPAGHLALVWNTRDSTTPWTQELDLVLRSAQPPTLRGDWGTDSVHALDSSPWFAPPERADFDHTQMLSLGGLRGLVASRSYVIALDPAAREALLAQVSALFEQYAQAGDELALPYRTQCWRSFLSAPQAGMVK